jgi:hypothetical protein
MLRNEIDANVTLTETGIAVAIKPLPENAPRSIRSNSDGISNAINWMDRHSANHSD